LLQGKERNQKSLNDSFVGGKNKLRKIILKKKGEGIVKQKRGAGTNYGKVKIGCRISRSNREPEDVSKRGNGEKP